MKKIYFALRKIYNPFRSINNSKPIDMSMCLVVTNCNNYYNLRYMEESQTFFNVDDDSHPQELGYIVSDWSKEVVRKWKYIIKDF